MIDDIKIDVWAAGLTVTFPLALSRRGVNRQGDLRVHVDDVEQRLRFFERLATPGSAAHVICLGEWSARDAGD